jgi:hypothetical protein
MLSVHWSRVFLVYFLLTAAIIVAGLLMPPPLHRILLVTGAMLVAGFVPLVMAIYFLRGLRGNPAHAGERMT